MKNIFNDDAVENQGYYYTTNISLSSKYAGRRMTDITLESLAIKSKNILDIGCGDGTHTIELDLFGEPNQIVAGDVADKAIKIAHNKSIGRKVYYMVNSAYELPFQSKSFDVAILRAVLHYLDNPRKAIQEALRVADIIWVIEPNGYNPGLKFNENFSTYHIAHQEKSYAPHMLNQWVEQLGGKVLYRKWAGFVPMFCPDWMANVMKWLEPVVEHLPGINRIGCAIYYFSARSK
ncbi:MAG: class I SAM-dependent methyltransferase [Chloroflexota bacterium]